MNDERETHPSFGLASVSRVQSGGGISLFDSEIRHTTYVELEIRTASRRRDIHRDWIHEDKLVTTVRMSMSQWAALVSSFNTSGVPVTLTWTQNDSHIEEPPYEPRMKQSVAEVKGAATALVAKIRDAFAEVEKAADSGGKKALSEALRSLRAHISNAEANAVYAADTFTEHVENVVTKARFDIEATVQMAQERGLAAGDDVKELLQ